MLKQRLVPSHWFEMVQTQNNMNCGRKNLKSGADLGEGPDGPRPPFWWNIGKRFIRK